MRVPPYLHYALGESPENTARLHPSTLERLRAYGIAIHIPVILWAITGYVIAARVFNLDLLTAMTVAALCVTLIYMVERLILAMPKAWYVNLGRLIIGCITAIIGASAVDLIVFDKEIAHQLRESGAAAIRDRYEAALSEQRAATSGRREAWLKAQTAANCEADGTCGSRVRSVGPIYRQLASQAQVLRRDYEAALAKLDWLQLERQESLEGWRVSDRALVEAGLLARMEALHRFAQQNPLALAVWSLFFALVLALELTVVLTKLAFRETVDDRISAIREEISYFRAIAYREATTSPVAHAVELLHGTQC